jgi:hypothetical protein
MAVGIGQLFASLYLSRCKERNAWKHVAFHRHEDGLQIAAITTAQQQGAAKLGRASTTTSLPLSDVMT